MLKKIKMSWLVATVLGLISCIGILTYYGVCLAKDYETSLNIIVSCILIVAAYVLFIMHGKEIGAGWKIISSILIFLAVPVFSVISIWDYTPVEGQFWVFMLNVFLLFIFQCIIFALTLNMRVTIILCTIVNCFLFTVDEVVFILRKTPLVPSDIASFKTAMAVSGNYKFQVSSPLILAICAGIFLIVCAVKIPIEKKIIPFKTKLVYQIVFRLCFVLAAGVLAFYMSSLERSEFTTDNFDVENMNANDGIVLTFYLNCKELSVEAPDGYTTESAKEELASYEDDSESADFKPNVIVIMDEAFSDLSILGDLETNEDPLEFCHSLEKDDNVISGHLNVSVWGGSTCNTEFEVLTGDTLEMLPYGSIPYNTYVSENTDSICNYFHNLGYTNIAIHPYWGQCWRRDTVYQQFGFDTFIDAEDFDEDSDTKDISDITIHDGYDFGDDLDYVRNYISDQESFNQIIKQYESKDDDENLFIFNVTMQNHGGYLYEGDNYEETITCGRIYSKRVNQYLSLIDKTDEAFKNLIEYFENVDEPTVIMMYGDHQPGLENSFYETMFGHSYDRFTNQDFKDRYTVPYYIWANYDLNDVSYDDVSANYLSMVLKDAAGLPFDSWDTFRSEVYKEYPILTAREIVDKYGVISCRGSMKDDLLDAYERMQYYKLFEFGK